MSYSQKHTQDINMCSDLKGTLNESANKKLKVCYSLQGIIALTGTETRQLFSRMFVTLKNFAELFYPD